jgi:hypothetical protein
MFLRAVYCMLTDTFPASCEGQDRLQNSNICDDKVNVRKKRLVLLYACSRLLSYNIRHPEGRKCRELSTHRAINVCLNI